jgi:phospholipase A2
MAGPILKQASKGGTTSLVDIYGVLVASRLFVPDDLSDLDPFDLKLSSQRKHIEVSLRIFEFYLITQIR